jgi:hypothetical protein
MFSLAVHCSAKTRMCSAGCPRVAVLGLDSCQHSRSGVFTPRSPDSSHASTGAADN